MPEHPRTDAFSWTQFAGAAPGLKALGEIVDLDVADVGCGTGRTSSALAGAGARVTGIDIDASRIDRRHEDRVRFEVADATEFLATRPAEFDLVVSKFGALDFAPLGPLLATAHTALRPGGRLAASSRHPDWDQACRQLGLPSQSTGAARGSRRNLLDQASWQAQLSHAGYEPIRMCDVHLPRPVLATYLAAAAGTAGLDLVDQLATVPACTVMLAEVTRTRRA